METEPEAAIEVHLHLHETIIGEILSRLPVKSLFRFKCVSKSWNSFISTKRFIKSHLQNSKQNKVIPIKTKPPGVRILLYKDYLPILSIEQHTLSTLQFDCKIGNHKGFDVVIGSCNGLICVLVDGNKIFLWNPATKESKRLPNFHGGVDSAKRTHIISYGFGYDESRDDYKMFVNMSVRVYDHFSQTIGKVYSLKANSWTRFKITNGHSVLESAGKLASGKLHWITTADEFMSSIGEIVTFDMKSEAFGVVELPPTNVQDCMYPTLGVLDGYICMLCDYCAPFGLDVWSWDECCWTRLVKVWYPCGRRLDPICIRPVCIMPKGDVLFIHGRAFLSYNPRNGWFWYPRNSVASDEVARDEFFVESMVSPAVDQSCDQESLGLARMFI